MGGGRHRENVYAACRGYVVVLALGDLVAWRHFTQSHTDTYTHTHTITHTHMS